MRLQIKLNFFIVNIAETSMDAALLSSAVIGSIIGVFIFIFMIYKVCQKKTAKKIQVCYQLPVLTMSRFARSMS